MTITGKSLFRIFAGTLLLTAGLTCPALARAAQAEDINSESAALPANEAESAAALATQVGEIARSPSLSRSKKEKRISTTVRVAVVAATAYKSDRGEILSIALSFTKAAASAAPPYAEAIANAVSFAPPLKQIDSAPGQVRTAAFAAAKNPHTPTRVASRPPAPPAHRTKRAAPAEPTENVAIQYPAAPQVEAPSPESEEPPPMSPESPSRTAVTAPGEPKISLGSNTSLAFTAELGARHDDNIFLTTADKVGDTILTVVPGFDFRYGTNSLAHGSMQFRETFLKYAQGSAASQSLAYGAADFGYNDGSVTVDGTASYQQLYQNNRDVAALGTQTIFRSNVLDVMTSAETHVTPKTSFKGGLDINSLQYEDAGLIGTRDVSVPLKVYYATTPKVAVSAGFTYEHIQEQHEGPDGKDLYYNLGARGDFTAKLSGEISAGLHARQIGTDPRQELWGFDGSLNYEISPKTTSSLVLSRQFNTSAQGQTLTNSSYALKLSNDPALQWHLSAGVTYQDVEYEPVLVFSGGLPVFVTREDNYWEGNLDATFVFSYSLSLSAGYTYRRNNSNLPGAVFSNNIFSLMLDWRY